MALKTSTMNRIEYH